MRRASVAKKHSAGLWSIGPDEEWSFDGHEQILAAMDLAIYGGVDKFSRYKLGMYVVSRHQQADVGMAIFLLCVHKLGRTSFHLPRHQLTSSPPGLPLQTITDMGSETSMLAAVQRQLLYVLHRPSSCR